MPKAKTRPLTRQKSDTKYGAGSSELFKREPSIYRQLIRYYYHLKNTDPQSSISQYCRPDKRRLDGYLAVIVPAITFNIHIVNRKKDKRFAAVRKRYQSKTP